MAFWSLNVFCSYHQITTFLWETAGEIHKIGKYLHKQSDASVCHSVGKTQDATAHDGVAQVEDRHAKGGIALVLWTNQRLEHEGEKVFKSDGCVGG